MVASLAALKDLRLRRPSVLTIFSVLLPGIALIVEALALVSSPGSSARFGLDDSILGSLPDAALIGIAVSFGVGLAYPLGLLNREFGFWLLERGEATSGEEVKKNLEAAYGPDVVAGALAPHPAIVHYFGHPVDRTRRGHPPDNVYLLPYFKYWIESYAAPLSAAHLETEINLLLSLPMPFLLAPVVAFRLLGWSPAFAGISLAAIVLTAAAIEAARRRRYYELEVTMRHFVYAQVWAKEKPNPAP